MNKYYHSIDALSFYRLFAEWLSSICPRDTIYRLADNMSICRWLSEVAMYETEAWRGCIFYQSCARLIRRSIQYFRLPQYDLKFAKVLREVFLE